MNDYIVGRLKVQIVNNNARPLHCFEYLMRYMYWNSLKPVLTWILAEYYVQVTLGIWGLKVQDLVFAFIHVSLSTVHVLHPEAGSEIALSWSPMRLKIFHWQPEFHNWSPAGN